ncbi:LysR family transcriptional regulator [Agarivorans aestuarii]|uniref:LysR family transcriptional regulator n=1 Tax=Agarivorans aestuarii TaxID=1563703 RepID=UPI001C7EE687|nr:LysR family transcriptional regulator [Agarivorans aestuarii]
MRQKLENLDLNLLRLLCAVVEKKNTHIAAEKLGISQTSVSRGMAKLRECFGDRLFIRKAHGVEPSALAEKLAEAASEMLTPFLRVIDSFQEFNAQEYDGTIKIAAHLLVLEVHGANLSEALHAVFPNANLELVYWQEDTLVDILKTKVDYLIHFQDFQLPQDIHCPALTEVSACLVAKKGHPVLTKTSDWEAVAELPMVKAIIDGVDSKREPIDDVFAAKGYKPRLVFSTHSISALLNKLAVSDAIMFGSANLAKLNPDLESYPLPPFMPSAVSHFTLVGGYLQSKRDFPLTQAIHKAVQSYFDGV